MVTKYLISDIEDFDEFLNKLFAGLKYYEKHNKEFRFKLRWTKNYIELTTIKLPNGSYN